jgi:hypothetical protein
MQADGGTKLVVEMGRDECGVVHASQWPGGTFIA